MTGKRLTAVLASLVISALAWLPVAVKAASLDEAVAAYDAGDHNRAREIFGELATAGVAEAQYSLGVMAHAGVGQAQDDKQAVRWFRQAAEQDHLNSMFNLGIAYWEGAGVEQDVGQAVRWWRRAAELGLPEAQHNLGTVYYLGKGAPKDYALAVAWFRRAARNGHPEAGAVLAKLSEKYPDLAPMTKSAEVVADAAPVTPATEPPTAAAVAHAAVAEAAAPEQPAARVEVEQTAAIEPPAVQAKVEQTAAIEPPASRAEAPGTRPLLASPAGESPMIGSIDVAARLQVLKRQGQWLLVNAHKGVEVWVYGRYVEELDGRGRITADQVRARPTPSIGPESDPVGVFNSGDQVDILSTQGRWKQVRANGSFAGWIDGSAVAEAVSKRWNWRRVSADSTAQPDQAAVPAAVAAPADGSAGATPVYAFASPRAPVIGSVDAAAGLEVLQRQGDWMLVRVPEGVDVWVYGRYVDGVSGTGRVNTDQVRARPLPSTADDSTPLGVFRKDDVVEIMSVNGDWKRVRTLNRVAGWVHTPDI